VPLDIALRRLLAQFRLPGEAQKIDRIMEKVRLKLWAFKTQLQLGQGVWHQRFEPMWTPSASSGAIESWKGHPQTPNLHMRTSFLPQANTHTLTPPPATTPTAPTPPWPPTPPLQFAERFVKDNASGSAFRNADGAYLLSFAIIMLNTDVHNPVAEGRLGKADFVNMCHQPLSEHAMCHPPLSKRADGGYAQQPPRLLTPTTIALDMEHGHGAA